MLFDKHLIDKGNKNIVENFNESVKLKENKRYEIKLPVKENLKSNLPDNYLLAKSRLESPQKRFLKNKKPFEEYDNIFQQYLKDNLIGKVPNEETDTLSCNFHYLPRRAVIRNYHITTKLRIVFDASAHYTTELCLNNILEAGPCLLPYLLNILLGFRTGKIAVAADLKQAFLQIEMNEDDRNFVRFLWFDDIHKENPSIVEYPFAHLVFGLTCSPSLLNTTAHHQLTKTLLKG